MITLTKNNLDLGNGCQLVSCVFDIDEFKANPLQHHEQNWDVTVPTKILNAVDKRKAEFIAGRYCAKQAMHRLHADNFQTAIEIGEKRQPLWPDNIVGSITHSHGFAAAVAANAIKLRSVGIDSEYRIAEKTANNVSSHILTDDENFEQNTNEVKTAIDYLTLVFSAKESIFKCLHPIVLQYFDFRDATITLCCDKQNNFEFKLLKHLNEEFCEGYQGRGHYQFDGDFVHTAVLLNR